MANKVGAQKLSAEQLELFIKLGNIFMPHSREQRDFFYKYPSSITADVSARFVHYTSAEAALSIIKSKRVWMRNTMCMSDFSEVQHGYNMLKNFFSDEANKKAFISTLDSCVPGAAIAAITAFDNWWTDIRFRTYIASISEHDDKEDLHGRLSMWRAFGNSTSRVAIVLKIPWSSGGALALNLMFNPVSYLTEPEFLELTRNIMTNIEENRDFLCSVDHKFIIGTVFAMLLSGATCLKHEGFKEEREWRAIYSPSRNPSPLMESSIEVVGGIPQPIYRIPLEEEKDAALSDLEFSRIFDRLIIGPTQYGIPMYDAFSEALKDAGVIDANSRVFISGIPIRT